jgi:hypothetical protein
MRKSSMLGRSDRHCTSRTLVPAAIKADVEAAFLSLHTNSDAKLLPSFERAVEKDKSFPSAPIIHIERRCLWAEFLNKIDTT